MNKKSHYLCLEEEKNITPYSKQFPSFFYVAISNTFFYFNLICIYGQYNSGWWQSQL
jgi:hypothetical protein